VNFYKEIKNLLLNRYKEMEENKLNSIIFFGAGEVAELAYLYLQLTNMRLVGIVDDMQNGNDFFEYKVEGLDRLERQDWDTILLTRLEDTDQDIQSLLNRGVSPERIATL
jgi:hypothetical protein